MYKRRKKAPKAQRIQACVDRVYRHLFTEGSSNVSVSLLNYDLTPDIKTVNEITRRLHGVTATTYGFMGYVHFEKDGEEK